MAYQFDHAWREERARLAGIEQAFDPWTIHSIEATTPQRGWRCLEVGGGGGSIAEWLSGRVGPTGHVVATDLETKFLEAIEADNVEVRKHNIVSDPLEAGHYDLIHSRAVLDHLPERDEILQRLVQALKPGGWLAIEAGDFSTVRMVGGDSADGEFSMRRSRLSSAYRDSLVPRCPTVGDSGQLSATQDLSTWWSRDT